MGIADDLLRDGDLAGARAALVEAVRKQPGDEQARMFLFQLFAVAGEWDKARSQLAALASLSAEAQMLAVAYGQAIDAERERAAVLAGTQRARQHSSSAWYEGVVDALELLGKGDVDGAEAARDAAFDAAPDTPGTVDDVAFDWIADADGRFGPGFEAIIGGRYGLQPFDQVEKIVSKGPKDLRDTVWYPVQIFFRSAQSVAAMLPARYPGSETSTDAGERLGKVTSWRETPAGEIGSGQRLWSLSTGDDVGLLSVRALTFA